MAGGQLEHGATDRAGRIDILIEDVEVVRARHNREVRREAVLPEVRGVELALADPLRRLVAAHEFPVADVYCTDQVLTSTAEDPRLNSSMKS